MEIYTVQQGDTAAGIAAKYGVSVQRLIYDNQLFGLSYLPEGMALLVLVPALVHTAAPEETVAGIAERYGMTEKQLLRNNPFLLEQEYLPAGQNLVIRYQGEKRGTFRTGGYAYPFIASDILRETLLYLHELFVFSYGFTTDGDLIPPFISEDWMIREAWEAGVTPILVLTPFSEQGTFNNQLVKLVVEDLSMQRRLIENLLRKVREKGYAGVDVDFEYILPEDRVGYAQFMQNLRGMMNREGYQVSVALVPKTSGTQPGLLYEGMDYRLLGESADQVFLMTYEWGYTYGPAMAIAPLNQVQRVLDYAVTEIPLTKILMGVPNYAYDWTLPFQKGISMAELMGNLDAVQRAAANGAAIRFDETAQSPYFTYWQEGTSHEVWFEDVRSIRAKVQTALDYRLLGIGYWNLMKPFRANWLLLNAMLELS